MYINCHYSGRCFLVYTSPVGPNPQCSVRRQRISRTEPGALVLSKCIADYENAEPTPALAGQVLPRNVISALCFKVLSCLYKGIVGLLQRAQASPSFCLRPWLGDPLFNICLVLAVGDMHPEVLNSVIGTGVIELARAVDASNAGKILCTPPSRKSCMSGDRVELDILPAIVHDAILHERFELFAWIVRTQFVNCLLEPWWWRSLIRSAMSGFLKDLSTYVLRWRRYRPWRICGAIGVVTPLLLVLGNRRRRRWHFW
jgi:hypothetical protein